MLAQRQIFFWLVVGLRSSSESMMSTANVLVAFKQRDLCKSIVSLVNMEL